MLRPALENKVIAPNRVLRGELDGTRMDRETLERTRSLLLDSIALTTDAEKSAEMVIRLAKVNTALGGFDSVQRAEMEAQEHKRAHADEERSAAAAAAQQFRHNCDLIACQVAFRRFPNPPLQKSYGTNTSEEHGFRLAVSAYSKQLFDALSFDDAQKQADEIYSAQGRPAFYGNDNIPAREWEEVVSLPKFNPNPEGYR